MARTYRRDNRGRFAGGGGGGGKPIQRGTNRLTRDNAGRITSVGGTGATARGGRLRTASGKKRATQTANISARPASGTVSRRRPAAQKSAANSIRRTGKLNRIEPGNSIKSTTRARRGPLAIKANAIRVYSPKNSRGIANQLKRRAERSIKKMDDAMRSFSNTIKDAKPKLDKISRRIERMNAQAMQNRLSKSAITRMVAGVEIGTIGTRSGQKALRRRMERASAAAARGSKPAAKARAIYANQMAFMGSGKTAKGKSNIRPGPRNTQGPPKRKRKRKAK